MENKFLDTPFRSLSFFIDDKEAGEVQTYNYNSHANEGAGLLYVTFTIYNNAFEILDNLKDSSVRHSFAAELNNEYGIKIFHYFPCIEYKNHTMGGDINNNSLNIRIEFYVNTIPEQQIITPNDITFEENKNTNKGCRFSYCTNKEPEKGKFEVKIYIPEMLQKDKDIDEYITDENAKLVAYYDTIKTNEVYLDARAFKSCPCTITKDGEIYFKDYLYRLLIPKFFDERYK